MALLQRLVLLERERVDRTHEPQVSVEVARPAGEGGALGDLGAPASIATPGSQSKSVRMRSTAASSRMRFSASSTSRRCWRSRTPASCCSCSWRCARSASSRPPASLARSAWIRRSSRSRPSTVSIRAVSSSSRPPIAHVRLALGEQRGAVALGRRLRLGIPRQARLDLGQAARQHRAPLVDGGDAHRVLPAQPAHLELARVEIGERGTALGSTALGLGLGGGELGRPGLERGDAGLLRRQRVDERDPRATRDLELLRAVGPLAGEPLARGLRRGRGRCAAWRAASSARRSTSRRSCTAARARSTAPVRGVARGDRALGRLDGLVERGTGDAGRLLGAEAPRPAAAEAVAGAGHHREVRVGDGEVHRGAPVAVGEHDPGEACGRASPAARAGWRARTRRAVGPRPERAWRRW